MTDPISTGSASKPTKASEKSAEEVQATCSSDATYSTYAENTDPALADLNPPTGQHVEQTIGEPTEVAPGERK